MSPLDARSLPLMAWLSPAYPVGAYAYSHGLEWAVEAGDVRDEASLAGWLGDVLRARRRPQRPDPVRPTPSGGDVAASRTRSRDVNDLALALAPSRELHLETSQQGRSFLDATLGAWPCAPLSALAEHLPATVAYPVAVGAGRRRARHPLAAAARGLRPRLRPEPRLGGDALGAGRPDRRQRVRRRARAPRRPRSRDAAAGLRLSTPSAAATFRLDLGSFRHETQYTRLFRS